MRIKLFILFIGAFLVLEDLNCQTNECYSSYTFNQFLNDKVHSSRCYRLEIYRAIRYPAINRKQWIEEDIKVIMIHHSNQEIEILPITDNKEFKATIIKSINEANRLELIETEEKFMIEITFKFDLEPRERNINEYILHVMADTIRPPIITR